MNKDYLKKLLAENKNKLAEFGTEKIGIQLDGEKVNIVIDFGEEGGTFQKIGGVMMLLSEALQDVDEEVNIVTPEMLENTSKIEYI